MKTYIHYDSSNNNYSEQKFIERNLTNWFYEFNETPIPGSHIFFTGFSLLCLRIDYYPERNMKIIKTRLTDHGSTLSPEKLFNTVYQNKKWIPGQLFKTKNDNKNIIQKVHQ